MKQKDLHYLAFDSKFFAKWQKVLLWLLNAPVIKNIFRWIMCIHNYDCSLKERIIKIAPEHFTIDAGLQYFFESSLLKTVWENPNETRKMRRLAKKRFIKIKLGKLKDKKHLLPALKTDFRTHWKWSKRIYFAFKPMWWAMHYWDEFFADKFAPQFSFGFSVLTAYPDPNPETNSMDAYVHHRIAAGGTWAAVHDAATANYDWDATAQFIMVKIGSSASSDKWVDIIRIFTLFLTSSLGAGATISDSTLSGYGYAKADSGSWSPTINVYTSSPASNTAISDTDYDQVGTTAQCNTAKTYSGFSITGYNDFTLNATGIGNINKTGVSKFGMREATYDVANSAPTWASDKACTLKFYAADNTGTDKDPKLVVTYTAVTNYYQVCSETLALTDTLLKQPIKTFSETLYLSDTLTSRITGKIFSETLLLSDTFSKSLSKILNEVLTFTDSIANLKIIPKTLEETLVLTDSVIKTTSRIFSEALTLTDTLIKTASRTFSEALTLTDTYARLLVKVVTLTETIILKDKFIPMLNGLLAWFADKFTKRNTTFTNKHSARGTGYSDKFTKRNTTFDNKF